MDIDFLRGLATIFCMLGFLAVVFWAFSPSRKSRFEKDAQIPFEEELEEKR